MESMEIDPGAIPRPAGCRNRVLSPESLRRWRRRYGTFRGIVSDRLGFSHRGEFIGGRASPGGARGPHTGPGAAQGAPAPRPGVAALLAFFDSPSGFGSLLTNKNFP